MILLTLQQKTQSGTLEELQIAFFNLIDTI